MSTLVDMLIRAIIPRLGRVHFPKVYHGIDTFYKFLSNDMYPMTAAVNL